MSFNSLAVFHFESHDIRFVEGKPIANDVAKALGYADPAATVTRKVLPKNKSIAKTITVDGKLRKITVLEEAGIIQLVANSQLPKAIDIAKQMGLLTFHSLPEQESVRVLESAFADLSPVRQFAVCGYRIDLYLAKANIAIECDENGHSNGYSDDPVRKQKIKSAIGCSFVRYNPNKIDFNLGDVIFTVRGLV